MRLPLALLLALLPTTVAFADDRPAVDLVAGILIGASDGATWSFFGQLTGVLKQTGPGLFETTSDGHLAQFAVTEKSGCVFDVVFKIDSEVQGGIELDAHKLKSVTFSDAKPQAGGWTDYAVALDGADGVVQLLSADGELSETAKTSSVSTSLTQADLEADAAALQATYCPAAA